MKPSLSLSPSPITIAIATAIAISIANTISIAIETTYLYVQVRGLAFQVIFEKVTKRLEEHQQHTKMLMMEIIEVVMVKRILMYLHQEASKPLPLIIRIHTNCGNVSVDNKNNSRVKT